jgi:hypothetical protein
MSKKEKSPIDELFFELYGYYPNKAGQAYEIISAAAIKILTGKQVKYDQHVKGKFSKTDYQLDGEIVSNEATEMLEAKDYTIDDRKVGRGDIQKLAGALIDLDIDKGLFASATDFTKPADKYADSTKINPNQKQIDLFHIRPTTELDEEGRIKKFVIKMHIAVPDLERGQYRYEWTDEAIKKFEVNNLLNKELTMSLSEFYDKDGNVVFTLMDFTRNNQPDHKDFNDEFAIGNWDLSNYFIKFDNEFYGIKKIHYKVPYDRGENEFTIERGGKPKILIKSFDGKTDKLLTDEQFKKLSFNNKEIK